MLRHTSHVITGLYDLAHQKRIRLSLTNRSLTAQRKTMGATLWVQATCERRAEVKNVCFDMIDARTIDSPIRLDECDVYFKRSYLGSYLDEAVEPQHRSKIEPYGLYFACKTKNQRNEFEFATRYLFSGNSNGMSFADTVADVKRAYGPAARSLANRLGLVEHFSHLVDPTNYEQSASNVADPSILFITRIWDLADVAVEHREMVAELNAERVDLVTKLRQHFPKRFFGGLMEEDVAIQSHPDLVIKKEVCTRIEYLKLMQSSAICVTSRGLHDSTGAKLPEYMAAARCIVSERRTFELPEPLNSPRTLLDYATPDDCIEHCENLLSKPDRVASLMIESKQYYSRYVKPCELVARRLNQLFPDSISLTTPNAAK